MRQLQATFVSLKKLLAERMGNTCCTKDSPKEKRRNKILRLPKLRGRKTILLNEESDTGLSKKEGLLTSKRSTETSTLMLSENQMFNEELE